MFLENEFIFGSLEKMIEIEGMKNDTGEKI